jgi:hypothetical protein
MATATKPYVVPEGIVEPAPEMRSGWMTFAGIVFLFSAFANLIWGLGALADKAYLNEGGLLYSTLETWGWVAVIWSGVVFIAALLLLARVPAAPVVGIVLASVSCLFWLFALPVLPLFAMTVILIDMLVIYVLNAHGLDAA